MARLLEMPSREKVFQVLEEVIDPELGVNIVDLGMVYSVEISERKLRVDLTMTTPSCPMGDMIMNDARQHLMAVVPTDAEIHINLVWEPPWGPEKMSDNARYYLGWDEGATEGSAE